MIKDLSDEAGSETPSAWLRATVETQHAELVARRKTEDDAAAEKLTPQELQMAAALGTRPSVFLVGVRKMDPSR